MQVAVIGSGSLISSPGVLRLKRHWRRDGPPLPVEFARISGGNRLTLVIHTPSRNRQTYWAAAASEDLPEVRKNLGEREGTPQRLIHTASASGVFSDGVADDIQESVSAW